MFKTTTRSLFCLAGILFLINGFNLYSQNAEKNLQQILNETVASFEKGDYRSALPGYRKLIEAYPDNAIFSYRAGICLVELNEELDDAIELLFGSSKHDVPADVNYYLGLAYHRNYNFYDALKYFDRFEIEASRQELKEYNLSQLKATTHSAVEITATYNPYEVMNVAFIDLFDSLQFTQVKMKGGQLQRKPVAYYVADEDPEGLTSLVFVPPNAVRGDYIYYSGFAKNRKDGAQLFRVKKGTGKLWGEPEEIKPLNSPGDEILPYFDPIDNDLFFASNGRLGMGGFDLYRTHYDRERDQWSEPVNLGFPVNSVMDEYLLLPGSDLGMVMFFSTRQGTDSTVTVYRVHLMEPKKKTVASDGKMLKEIATLGGVASDILAEIEAMELAKEQNGSVSGPMKMNGEPVSTSEKNILPKLTEVTVLSEVGITYGYQQTLSEALRHQAVSDSLKDLASNARVLVRDSEDPNDRWVWQKQILLWEKKARDEEILANKLYEQMEMERSAQNPGTAVNIPEAIEVDTVMGELTVYRYRDPEPQRVGTELNSKVSSYFNSFEVLTHSPYNVNNPIPMDEPFPKGMLYRIQVGAFSAEVEPDVFLGMSPISGEHIEERGVIKYYTGRFTLYEDASAALSVVRSRGYEDAFIIAWYNGDVVSIQRAKQLE